MAPVPVETVARLLREADPETRRAFVAGVWTGRGWETTVEDGVVVAASPEGESRRLLVSATTPASLPEGVDLVVVAAPVDDAPTFVRDARALREELLYGLDRETAAALFEDCFDHPLVGPGEATPPEAVGWPDGRAAGERPDAVAGPERPSVGAGTDRASNDDGGTRRGPDDGGEEPPPDSGADAGGSRHPSVGALPGLRPAAWGDAVRAQRARLRTGVPDHRPVHVAVLALAVVAIVGAAAAGGFPGAAPGTTGVEEAGGREDTGAGTTPEPRVVDGASVYPTGYEDSPSDGKIAGYSSAGLDWYYESGDGDDPLAWRDPDGLATVPDERLPPGLGRDGVVDEVALADAHVRALANRSYQVELTHREFVGGRPSGLRRETVSVESPRRYRSELYGAGELSRSPLVVAENPVFVDGTVRTTLTSDGQVRENPVVTPAVQSAPGGRVGERVAAYVRWFLSVESSWVVEVSERDGRTYYWLAFDGDSYAGIANASGSALVDDRGVVHEVRRRYTYPGASDVSAAVTIRVESVGETTVDPPAWLDEGQQAGEATDHSTATRSPAP